MFGKLIAKIKRAIGERESYDPASQFDDPVAARTSWHPAKGGGSNFCTHKLVVGLERMEFRASVGARLFYAVFLFVGFAVMIGFSAGNASAGKIGLNAETIFPLLFGAVFASVGGGLWYFGTTPIVFDRRKGQFWKGRKSPDEVFDKSRIKCFTKFEEIHAIQLISEYCRGDKSSYYSYELNLVLESGERINVVDHGNQRRIQEDARKLAEFLDRPLWDAS